MNTQENTTKHTPGPWMTEYELRDGSPYIIYSEEGTFIADLRCNGCEAPASDAKFDANAALLKAAPHLLEALKGMLALGAVKSIESIVAASPEGEIAKSGGFAAIKFARAAIAEAEGKAISTAEGRE